MGAITDLWNSERGLVAIVALVCLTVLLALGRITSQQWIDAFQVVTVAYLGTKTLTSAAETFARARQPPSTPPTPPNSPSSTTTPS